jgi:hypothetical protein
MAEVLGVASGAVSIVSIGIQVARGLLEYYESWKNQGQDISDMCISLESLLRTLIVVSDTITPPAKFARSVTMNVERNVQPVMQAVNKLSDKLEKVLSIGIPKQSAQALMRRHIRRTLYPFREQTLLNIQRGISEARSNLDLALQALQVSVAYILIIISRPLNVKLI